MLKRVFAVAAVLLLTGGRLALGFAPDQQGSNKNQGSHGAPTSKDNGTEGQSGNNDGQNGNQGEQEGQHDDGDKNDGDHNDGEKDGENGNHDDGEKGQNGETGTGGNSGTSGSAGSQTSGATNSGGSHGRAARGSNLISKDAAIKAAQQQIHGDVKSVTLGQRDGSRVYDVVLNTTSGLIGVIVDAVSGTVLHIELR